MKKFSFDRVLGVRWRVLEVVAILLLAAALWWLAGMVGDVRRELARRHATLARVPQRVAALAGAQATLEARTHDIERLEAFTVSRQGLGQVIAAMEEAAGRRQVDLEVTRVQEVTVEGPAGEEVASLEGPLADVRLAVVAIGKPEQLLQFIHELEHLPYLLTIPSWLLTAQAGPAAQGEAGSAPVGGVVSGPIAPPLEAGRLEAELILSIAYESGQ